MILIGDVHGKWVEYKNLVSQFPGQTTIQVGDMGVGFPNKETLDLPETAFWIRGNHDNPELCRKHPNYLGDYGTKEIDGYKVFFLGGAWSIDRRFRLEGVSWWPDEELSITELNKAFDCYFDYKPDIVITHDVPMAASQKVLSRFLLPGQLPNLHPTRTGQALSAMFRAYKPKLWVFGHYHGSWSAQIDGTEFICLNELQFLDVNTVEILKERK